MRCFKIGFGLADVATRLEILQELCSTVQVVPRVPETQIFVFVGKLRQKVQFPSSLSWLR